MFRNLVVVALAALILVAGCGPEIKQWCDTYQKGYAYVETFAIPALDVATGMTPQWVNEYAAAKKLLGIINEELVAFCVRHSNGEEVSMEEVAPLVSQGSKILAEIIGLYQDLVIADATGDKDLRTILEAQTLMQELEQLSHDAGNK
jgi:hypothetical protein